MTRARRIETALLRFAADARTQAAAASDFNEERLTAPCRTLLNTVSAEFNKQFTVVDKNRIGESIPDLVVRNQAGLLVLCVELKAPGKGADPSKFRSPHDRRQWESYKEFANLIYTDGANWGLYHGGQRAGQILSICSDLSDPKARVSIDAKRAERLFEQALGWEPESVRSASKLAQVAARHCRALRDQVEDLPEGLLLDMTVDWRSLLFPDLDDEGFLDAYAQTVTFALLAAAGLGIDMTLPLPSDRFDTLNLQLHHVASELEKRRALLGKALSLLTSAPEIREPLGTHLEMLMTTLSGVDWAEITSGGGAWLHFYEDFLAVYDPELRKRSGSYYTPAGIVEWMTRFTDRLLEDPLGVNYASEEVLVVDPGVGTGTFLLGVLDRIAERIQDEIGPGAVQRCLEDAARARLIGFEVQSCPYAVAQLRLTERLRSASVAASRPDLRLYLTDTLADPESEESAALFFAPITQSRAAANRVKREEPVVVVIGNPPYLDHAGGTGGWVESELMPDWKPPADWGVGPHVKNRRPPPVDATDRP